MVIFTMLVAAWFYFLHHMYLVRMSHAELERAVYLALLVYYVVPELYRLSAKKKWWVFW